MKKNPKRPARLRRIDILRRNVEVAKSDLPLARARLDGFKNTSAVEVCRALNQLSDLETSKGIIFQCLYPSDYSKLFIRQPVPPAQSLSQELAWSLAFFSRFADGLAQFLSFKARFEDAFLRGEGEAAERQLTEIEATFGVSLWLIESRLALAQSAGGFSGNRSFLASIQEAKANSIVKVIAQLMSQRVEDGVSVVNFSHDLSKFRYAQLQQAKRTKDYDFAIGVLDYICARLDLYAHLEEVSLQNALCMASAFSLIDWYLCFVQIVQHLYVSDPEAIKDLFRFEIVNRLPDLALKLIKVVLSPTEEYSVTDHYPTLQTLLDAYTSGAYAEVVKVATQNIAANPSLFANYELLAKALIYQKSPFDCDLGLPQKSLRLLRLVYDVLSRTSESHAALYMLLKESQTLSSSRLASEATAFFMEHRISKVEYNGRLLRNINSPAPTPRLALDFGSVSQALKFLERSGYPENSPTRRIFESILRSTAPRRLESDQDYSVIIARYLRYKASYDEDQGDNEEAIESYNVLLESDEPDFVVSECLSGLFRCYMDSGRFVECARLVVSSAIRNPSLLMGINFRPLIVKMSDVDAKTLQAKVDHALLYAIASYSDRSVWDPDGVYEICEQIFLDLDIESPAKIDEHIHQVEIASAILFMWRILVPDVLCSWPTFASLGTSGVEDERSRILEILREKDIGNQSLYADEIAELRRNQVIRRGIQYIDETRIFINVEGIKRSLDDAFREKYSRLAKIQSLPIERLKRVLIAGSINALVIGDVNTSDDAFRIFTELFDALRSRYLASDDFGLDSYISMQIRHGALENQLRVVFERHRLITEKYNGEYRKNFHWGEFIAEGYEVFEAVDAALRRFSESIDCIIDRVRSEWLQVTTKRESDPAVFCYDFSDSQLARISQSCSETGNFEEFVDVVFDSLNRRTELNLKIVREKIEINLLQEFTEELRLLEQRLQEVAPSFRQTDLGRELIAVHTDIVEALKRVASWFRLVTDQTFSPFEFGDAVLAALEIVSDAFPNAIRNPVVAVTSARKFSGGAFRPFIHMLCILLENIAKHAPSTDSGVVEIEVVESASALRLRIANPVSESVDITKLREKVAAINSASSFREFGRLLRHEGGSGWPKLLKILSVDLQQRDGSISFKIDETTKKFEVVIELEIQGLVQ